MTELIDAWDFLVFAIHPDFGVERPLLLDAQSPHFAVATYLSTVNNDLVFPADQYSAVVAVPLDQAVEFTPAVLEMPVVKWEDDERFLYVTLSPPQLKEEEDEG